MKVYKVDNNIAPMHNKPVFRANIASATYGCLQQGTANRLKCMLNAYKEIQSKLSRLTAEGIEYINKNYPLVNVKEGLGFLKCGENGVYVLLRGATTEMYKDLMRIIVRKSDTIDGSRHMIDSFMLYRNDRAVTNFNPNRSKQFPEECILASSEELEKTKYDERLSKTLEILDQPILKFRIFLNKIPPEYMKKPDGILEYKYQAALKEASRLNKETEDLEKSLSHSTLYNYKRDNCPTYVLHPGLKSFVFKDLGPEKLTIQCADVESTADDSFKKLMVSDKNGKGIATYIINNNEKIVKNRSLTNLHYDSKNNSELIYLDSEEIRDKEYLDKFQQYLDLYTNELKLYNEKLRAFIDAFKATKVAGELSEAVQNKLVMCAKKAEELFNNEDFHDKALLVPLVKKGVATVTGGMRSGITFTDYAGNRKVQFKPINTIKHKNLYKLTVFNDRDVIKRCYLIKDFKYVVSNYNPYTQQVPDVLQLYDDKEIGTIEMEGVTDYLIRKFEEVKEIVDKADKYKEKANRRPVNESRQTWGRISEQKLGKPLEQLFEEGKKEFGEIPPKNQINTAKDLPDYGDYRNILSSWRRCFKMAVESANKSDLGGVEENIKKLYEKMKNYIIEKNK